MTTFTISRIRECASMNHVHLGITGAFEEEMDTTADDLLSPISDEEKAIFVKVYLRIYKIGKTNAQVRTALGNGIVVTI